MATPEQLLAVGPLDGRYADKVESLSPIVSEYGLIKYRVAVEVGWLSTLGSGVLPDVEPLSDQAQEVLRTLADDFDVNGASAIKNIEATTNHDVKAVEVWLKERLSETGSFGDYLELIHFGCTSEDINNLAYAMMLRDTRDKVVGPNLSGIKGVLSQAAREYARIPMMARTHGQPATPTTLGKEMAVFAERIGLSGERLGNIAIRGKFNGASGNYNAVSFVYPDIYWPEVSRKFVESLGFEYNGVTTQIEPHDWMATFFNEVAHGNIILTDLSRDMWAYISAGTFKQRAKEGEVGSSTMPHKVNPIDFENAEGNFGLANALLAYMASKLPISRLQRDLSDSTVQRAIGEAFGHTVVAHASLKKGMGKVYPDKEKMAAELDGEWSLLTEAVQTMMRRYKVEGGYDQMKAATRGKVGLTRSDYLELVAGVDLPPVAKKRLRDLTPATYLGWAADIAEGEV